MARIDDLIDLIQTANDIYLINPARNTRSAYIQIDDLCELGMKSYLQKNVAKWSPISHQHNGRDFFKSFPQVTNEIRTAFAGNAAFADLLDRIEARRDNRNRFFHDQNQAGLTVDDLNCLLAFNDLYALMSGLFLPQFAQTLQANPVVQAQVAVVKLRLRSYKASMIHDHYLNVLSIEGPLRLEVSTSGHEFSTIYRDPTGFLMSLRQHFEDQIAARQGRILYLSGLKSRQARHIHEADGLQREVTLFEEVINECLT